MSDINDDILTESSRYNQCRLHSSGFHYPRSFNTRKECDTACKKIEKEFSLVLKNLTPLSVVASLCVDYGTYMIIYNHEKATCDKEKFFRGG